MAYLKISPEEIKFAGAGAKLQWAMAIGIGVDQFVHAMSREASDDELLTTIKHQLAEGGASREFSDPSELSDTQKEVVDKLLQGVGTKLSTRDLHKAFLTSRKKA